MPGGACERAAMAQGEESKACVSADTGMTVGATEGEDVQCPDEGCTYGLWDVGMSLQQSCVWCACDEQRMDLQHCIACPDVAIAEQSKA